MALKLLTEKYADVLDGVLSCYDRIVIQGSIQPFCYAQGMTGYLYAHTVRIFDYPRWAEPLEDQIRAQAEAVAAEAGLTIEFIRKKTFAKKTGCAPCSRNVAPNPDWCTSFRPWNPAARISRGTTKPRGRPS